MAKFEVTVIVTDNKGRYEKTVSVKANNKDEAFEKVCKRYDTKQVVKARIISTWKSAFFIALQRWKDQGITLYHLKALNPLKRFKTLNTTIL